MAQQNFPELIVHRFLRFSTIFGYLGWTNELYLIEHEDHENRVRLDVRRVSQDDGIEVEKKPNVISGRKIGMTRPDRLDRIPKEDKNFSPLLKEKPSNVNEQRLSIC